MNERERIIIICRELGLPDGQWFLNGSGSMIMQGVTAEQRGKPMGDLDIFTTTQAWFELYERRDFQLFTPDPADSTSCVDPPYLYQTMYGLEVDVFFQWRVRHVGDFDVAFYMANSYDVDGVRCIPLQFILDWKREVGRAKDVRDIAILQEMLGGAVS